MNFPESDILILNKKQSSKARIPKRQVKHKVMAVEVYIILKEPMMKIPNVFIDLQCQLFFKVIIFKFEMLCRILTSRYKHVILRDFNNNVFKKIINIMI